MLPYSYNVTTSALRKHIEDYPIGYINNPGKGRVSMPETNTLSILYDEIGGGVWMTWSLRSFLHVSDQYPASPASLFAPMYYSNCRIDKGIKELCKLKVWVTSASPRDVKSIATNCVCNDDKERLIVNVPHGRSGKFDAQEIGSNFRSDYVSGNFIVKDYYLDKRGYINFDRWLKNSDNKFINTIPSTVNQKPKVLVISSWNSIFKQYEKIWTMNIKKLIELDEFDVVCKKIYFYISG